MSESTTFDRPVPVAPPVSRRAALLGLGGGGIAAALALAVSPHFTQASPSATASDSVQTVDPATVLGAWDLTFRPLDTDTGAGPARSLATFLPEGGFQAAMAPISVTPDGRIRFHGNGLGGWNTWDGNSIVVRYTGLVYDDAGNCDGVHQMTILVTPDPAFSTLSGAYESRAYDAVGELGESTSGTVIGVPARFRSTFTPTPAEAGPVLPVASIGGDLPPQPGPRGEPF